MTDWVTELRSAGVRSLDDFTHDQQERLGFELGMTTTEMHRAWESARSAPRPVGRRSVRSSTTGMSYDLEKGTYTAMSSTNRSGGSSARLSDQMLERAQVDHAMRVVSPNTVRAIEEVAQRMGFDGSKSPSKSLEYIQLHIKQLRAEGKKKTKRVKKKDKLFADSAMTSSVRNEDPGDRAWSSANLLQGILNEGQRLDNEAELRHAEAIQSLKRQIAGQSGSGSR